MTRRDPAGATGMTSTPTHPARQHDRRPDEPPDPRPAAGHHLLAGVDSVLPLLTSPPEPPPAVGPLVDDLRSALARTAACGDTCRVPGAADGVRRAVHLLLEGSTGDARLVLQHVRAELLSRP